MTTLNMETVDRGTCPVCAARISPQGTLVETEIVACAECQSLLVVETFRGGAPVFSEAPRVEEDWGE